MTEFTIMVDEVEYHGQLITYGYSYKILILIGDIPVAFEPDEERNYRAIVPPEQMNKVDTKLLESIIDELKKSL